MPDALLAVRHLKLSLKSGRAEVPILRDVSFDVGPGRSVGIVGESGSGKSMTTRAILRLLPAGAAAQGSISFAGDEVGAMSRRRLSALRATQVGMVYQDPRAHINPLRPIGDFLREGLLTAGVGRAEAHRRAIDLLRRVGVVDAERRMHQYPHQLSGGLLQRVMIVAALLPGPRLIIADEATTALDVTVQSDVLAVLQELKRERRAALLFITHDLDLAVAVTDDLVVMYAGRVVERGTAEDVYHRPRHPYTAALLASRPSPHARTRPVSIPGRPISAAESSVGCAFAPRCRHATDRCTTETPELRPVGSGMAACHHSEAVWTAAVSPAEAARPDQRSPAPERAP